MQLPSAFRGLSLPFVSLFIAASGIAACSGGDQPGSTSMGAPAVGGNGSAGATATAGTATAGTATAGTASAGGDSGGSGSGGSAPAVGGGGGGAPSGGADAGGSSGAAGGSALGGSAGAGGSGGSAGSGGGSSGPPSLFATSSDLVEVWVNGTFVGQSTATGALLSAATKLKLGAANIVAVRASKGSAAKPFLQAELDGAFGKAGTSTLWRSKAASTADELTGTAWAALNFDDNAWSAASDVKIAPTAPELVNGPAHGIWTSSASDATALFRTRIYLPADWSADKPYGFGSAVTGGAGGAVVTVKTSEELTAAVSGNTAKIVQVSGTIDFTGKEGTTSNTCCDAVTCAKGGGQIITDDLGACSGKTTFACSYDTAGTKPLKVGSNTTIIGLGSSATVKGKGFDLTGGVSNIIIRNLTITNLNPKVVWGGDAVTIRGASKVWIDHNRISLIGRQFLVSGFEPATEVTFSYNELDGNTPYSSNCDGTHYWTMLFAGSENTMTLMGNWIHHTSGRGPHAGGTSPVTQNVYAQFANDYYQNVTGHAADPAENANLLYEGTYFQSVKTPFVTTDGGYSYAPVASNAASTSVACSSAIGRSCVANADSGSATFPLNSQALTAMTSRKSSLVAAYPATEVPSCVPHFAGPGHI
jgi:pectin lyase